MSTTGINDHIPRDSSNSQTHASVSLLLDAALACADGLSAAIGRTDDALRGPWRKIESAPRDGRRVLLYDDLQAGKYLIAQWKHDAWWGDPTPSGRATVWRDETGCFWMPLPPAPNVGAKLETTAAPK